MSNTFKIYVLKLCDTFAIIYLPVSFIVDTMAEQRFRAFGNRLLRTILGHTMEERRNRRLEIIS